MALKTRLVLLMSGLLFCQSLAAKITYYPIDVTVQPMTNITVYPDIPSETVTLVSPSEATNGNTPTYTWNAVDTATKYLLWVADSTGVVISQWYPADQVGCSTTTTCQVTPSKALSGASEWWIRPANNAGNGSWSGPMNFTVSGGKPGKVTLTSPSGTTSDHTPTYTWEAVSGATWYYLWVNDSTGNKIKKWYTAAQAGCDSGAICSVTPATSLASGNGKWWVQTWNSHGYGPWSGSQSFTVSP